MRIAVNTRLLIKGKMDGIGWFTAETMRRIVVAHPEHTFYFFFDRKPDDDFIFGPNVRPIVLCPQARHPVLWLLFFEVAVKRALKRYKIDLYLTPDGMMPLRTGVPTVAVIHDLNFEHSSDNLRRSHQWYMRHYFPLFAKAAQRVATVSNYSKQDICNTYGISAEKVDVVYDGANALYRLHTEEEKVATRQRFTQGERYILFVSTILKRKNLANLLLAFDRVKDMEPDGLKLVVVGSRVWWQDELAAAYDGMRHKGDVVMLGHVEPLDLAALMSSADALVYPSFFEGFGIPILEAMYAETPVVASQTTSMPEVGGDAVIYVDPSSPEEIAQAIMQVREPETSRMLIERGRIQREKFSWERTAELLWECMMKAKAVE